MTIVKNRLAGLAFALVLVPFLVFVEDSPLSVPAAQADPWSGAIGGAIIGGLLTGRTGGAVAGAVIGGVAGGMHQSAKRQRYRERRHRQVRQYRQAPRRAYRKAPPRQSTLVIEVQRSLAKLGHDPGPVDGLTGARTSAAVREYQKKNNLLVDGRISPQLLDHMRARGG